MNQKPTIFVVEDDSTLQELYTYSLENEFNCQIFTYGDEFFKAISPDNLPELVILDVMLPGDSGFTILSRMKENKLLSNIPVIIVSAKGEEVSKVKGLNMGADDYISKPFSVMELIARIRANLRKVTKTETNIIAYKDVSIDLSRHKITIGEERIQTTLKEYNLLRMLCENAEEVQTRDNIFDEIWGGEFAGESRTLDIHIKELRKKLSAAGSKAEIETIRGVGYMLT
ncbi:MAG: response regulator transcription factor [Oscillospiraceae bacterium]|nr:response regulator transcription factor [Oscillospiraceae bacterium]